MKYIYYIKYFLHIAWNWNLRLALFTIYHEIRGENKYSINTSRLNDLQTLKISGNNRQHAEIYQGASYYLLEKVLMHLQKLNVPDAIADIGCGKGRVMVVASHFGFKRILGVEFAIELCRQAESNCFQITKRYPLTYWQVIHADAINFKLKKDLSVIFFFNPFNEMVMKQVIKNMLQSQKEHPRKIFVIYINPQHKNLLQEKGFKEIYYTKKMQFVEASVLIKDL